MPHLRGKKEIQLQGVGKQDIAIQILSLLNQAYPRGVPKTEIRKITGIHTSYLDIILISLTNHSTLYEDEHEVGLLKPVDLSLFSPQEELCKP